MERTDISEIVPLLSERFLIVGTTGSGKTTLAMELLPAFENVVAIDPIGFLGADKKTGKGHLEGFTLAKSPEQLFALGNARGILGGAHKKLQYRPDPEFDEWWHYDRVFEWVFRRGNTMLYNDEGYRVMRNARAPRWFKACMTGGRQKNVGMITCTQRPTAIDLALITESEHLACFRLRKVADRKRMGEQMGELVVTHPARGHSFWYMRDGDDSPQYFDLTLGD